MMEAKIIKILSGVYTVKTIDGIKEVKPVGKMRLDGIEPLVGDDCILNDKDQIEEIKKRKNELVRPKVANVDKVIIVTSLTEPALNLNLLDRLISVVEWNDIKIVLAFTKADLVDLKEYNDTISYYKSLGYPTYIIPNDMEGLKMEIDNSISVLAGQSGVGKSKIVNRLDSTLHLKEDEISYALGRGKHTTRFTELYTIGSGYIVDAPGFGNLDFEMDSTTLMQTFKEFFPNSCKFKECSHTNEPGCSVKSKVEDGTILKSRYDNYVLFKKEIEGTREVYIKKPKNGKIIKGR